MSYNITTEKGDKVEVPDGQWIVQHVYYERHYTSRGGRNAAPDLRDPELIGLGKHQMTRHVTCGSRYRNGGGGDSNTWYEAVVCAYPFAVIQCYGIGADYVSASVMPARQIHKGELGRYLTLPDLPKVVCQRSDGKGKTFEFVRWSDVAVAYGGTNPSELWKMFMPFIGHDFRVTYQEAQVTGRVYYPRRVDGPPVEYWSEAFSSVYSEERIEAYIVRMHVDPVATDRIRARTKEAYVRVQEAHEDWTLKMRERKALPPHILWDDPVLQSEHLCVPVAFARSVLTCKRFGYVPDFSKGMEAMARYYAHPAMP